MRNFIGRRVPDPGDAEDILRDVPCEMGRLLKRKADCREFRLKSLSTENSSRAGPKEAARLPIGCTGLQPRLSPMRTVRSVTHVSGLDPMMSGGADGIRTHDLLDAIEARSQLRHGPTENKLQFNTFAPAWPEKRSYIIS